MSTSILQSIGAMMTVMGFLQSASPVQSQQVITNPANMKVVLPLYLTQHQFPSATTPLLPIAAETILIVNTDSCGRGDYYSVSSLTAQGFTVVGYVDTSIDAAVSGGCCSGNSCWYSAGVTGTTLQPYALGWAQMGAQGVFFDDCAVDNSTQASNIQTYGTMTSQLAGYPNGISITNNAGYDPSAFINDITIVNSYEGLCSSLTSKSSKVQVASVKNSAICYGSGTEFTQAQMATYIQNAQTAGYHYLSIWPSSDYNKLPSTTFFSNFAAAIQAFNGNSSSSGTNPTTTPTNTPTTKPGSHSSASSLSFSMIFSFLSLVAAMMMKRMMN